MGVATFGIGYRHELGQLALDASVAEMTSDTPDGKLSSASIKVEGLWFMEPGDQLSPYVGGGVSYGGVRGQDPYVSPPAAVPAAAGVQGELSAGFALVRAGALQVFAQADLTLPFFMVETLAASPTRRLSGLRSASATPTSRLDPAYLANDKTSRASFERNLSGADTIAGAVGAPAGCP